MSRRVRGNFAKGTQKLDSSETEGSDCLRLNEDGIVDWTRLPDDAVTTLFTRLNYRDRANLSSTWTSWKSVGSSSCLWQSLDLRAHKCDSDTMHSLASRCSNLRKLRLHGSDNTESLINLRANNLKELSFNNCQAISDSALAEIVAHHNLLESIELAPDFCERITSDAIVAVAMCCPKLKKLRLSGVAHVNTKAITALGNHCPDLHEIGFVDCLNIDEVDLANVVSLRFLSVAGSSNVDWNLVGKHWCSLPYLKGLDVSGTNVPPEVAMRLMLLKSLKLLCAFDCPALEEDTALHTKARRLGIMMLGLFNHTCTELSRMFPGTFSGWRSMSKKDGILDEFMSWVEWILAHALLWLAGINPIRRHQFWVYQGAHLLLDLLKSSQEGVQELAAIGLATFALVDDITNVDAARAKAAMYGGGVELLLGLATSWKEGIQSVATQAIANLSVNPEFAETVVGSGGITILTSLARSMNEWVAEEAARGLCNLSNRDEYKEAIVESGAIKALVDSIFKWTTRGTDGVQERAAGALANLAVDGKCSLEVVAVGGVKALATLARICKRKGVLEQAARALANLTAHGDSNSNIISVGQEVGVVDALVRLIPSIHEAVRSGDYKNY